MEIKIGDFGISKELRSYTTQMTNNKAGCIYYLAPEILEKGLYNAKSDMWSLGCLIYELLTLNIYFLDKLKNETQKINSEYNYKWQELINKLLQINSNKRLNIDQVYNILEKDIDINRNEENNIIENEGKNMNKYENKIIGEIYINVNEINKDIQIINSFENCKRACKWEDKKNDYEYENEKEINEIIEIKINGKIIEFAYYYNFKNEGKYMIEYTFKKNLTKKTLCFVIVNH